MFVLERFEMESKALETMEPQFGYDGFGEAIFYRTYSRRKPDGRNENWRDVVTRVVNGTFSIRKDWYVKNHIEWNERYWQEYAEKFAISMFKMEWLPPGRGLWAMGTDYVYERGSMALYNCAATKISSDKLAEDLGWIMDLLMCGVGVGFKPERDDNLKLYQPNGFYDWTIPDTREGWVESVIRLVKAFTEPDQTLPNYDYSEVRGPGLPINGFGGISSGPQPLIELHDQIIHYCLRYINSQNSDLADNYDSVMLKTDLANLIGCCVVAGNSRRSAEIGFEHVNDDTFRDLKNYSKYPYREGHGWMSNNSVLLENDEDFDQLDKIARRVVHIGEPGIMNLRNFPQGRIGKNDRRSDRARRINPCQPYSAPVLTPQGVKKFGELKENDVIWSELGWTSVVKVWSTGINKVYRYRTTACTFYGTQDHQVVCDSHKIPIKDSYGIDTLRGKKIENNIHDTQAILDGFVMGDGFNHYDHVVVEIGQDDSDILSSEIYQHFYKQYSDENTYIVNTTLHQHELARLPERKIPERFIFTTQVKIASFLRGLYTANGSICGGRVTLKSTSIGIIESVQLMLSALGIRSYYTTNKETVVEFDNGPYLCKESYDLNITTDREVFYNHIGFIQNYKSDKLRKLLDSQKGSKPKKTFDIISVDYLGEEETFDITVSNSLHTYWTQGCNVSNCGEVPLEDKELCDLAETFPTICQNVGIWFNACEYATFYTSTVSLLPTHQPETNKVIARNRRIGVGIVDFIGWKTKVGTNKVIRHLRDGYDKIREVNKKLAEEAGVTESIRVTLIKPGGTVPKLAGRRSGIGHDNFRFMIRRVRAQQHSMYSELLIEADVPHEPDLVSANTEVFEFPVDTMADGVPVKTAEEVSIWEQAMNLVLVQREWADNSVSNTLYFRPKWVLMCEICDMTEMQFKLEYIMDHQEARQLIRSKVKEHYTKDKNYKIVRSNENCLRVYKFDPKHEEDDVEAVLSAITPLIKTLTICPHTPKGVYPQMPEEGITEEEYLTRKSRIKPIDWSKLSGMDGQDERYCSADSCMTAVTSPLK